MDSFEFIAELSKLRSSSTFLSLNGYKNESGEIANYNIVFHISYKNSLVRSLEIVNQIIPENDLEAKAKNELIDSFQNSLNKMEQTSVEENEDYYTHFKDENCNFIKGVKMHNTTGALHLYGMVVNKKVLVPGNYKTVNKRPLTVAKDKLKKNLPVSKFRQFKITTDQVESISVENISLMPPDEN